MSASQTAQPEVSIRRALVDDVAAVRDLTRSAYAKWIPSIGREVTPATQDYDQIVRQDPVDLLFVDGELVALVWVVPHPDHLLIESLAVAPARHGEGHGRRMLAHAEALAVAQGLPKVRLYTNQKFTSNIEFYRRHGYGIDREETFWGGVKVHMSKRVGDGPRLTSAGVGRPAVWRWQRRFAEAGVDGLLRDASRRPGKPPVPAAVVQQLIALTCAAPPGEATHWTGRAMARAMGVSLRTVQRIWQTHRLRPHRIRTFKRSTDPDFAAKLEDVVGLYVAPPKHALVLSIDEKSQIQALDRTQPGLPLKPGKAGTITHDYVRNGTTTLFAALNVLEGTVIGRCMQRHRHQELLRFLGTIERAVPAGKLIHAILDNYGSHKHPKVKAWLARHPRWTFHFTPKSGSWLNAVETFFSALTRRRIRRGSFHSIVDLQAAINRYIAEHNDDPKPFTWTKPADHTLAKLNRLNASVH